MTRIIVPFLALALLVAPVSYVSADAWWGKGYRKPAWVLERGGSIINYTIKGGESDRYKAMMFRNGKYVEVEFGKNATFDDAKDGLYEIKFYKCEDSCSEHENNNKTKIRKSDDRRGVIFVTARAGETTYIEYNTNTDKAKIVGTKQFGGARTNGSKPVAPANPTYTKEQLIAFAAEREQGQVCDVKIAHPASADHFIFPRKNKTESQKLSVK